MPSAYSQQDTCLERLLALRAPSRLGARDATLFDAHPDDTQRAAQLLGWTDLCSRPPLAVREICNHANAIREEGLEAVVLIGQGGSSQAAMTITKLHEVNGGGDVAFRTMDSLSPVFVNHILGSSDPARTLYIVSSKSGSTIEPLMLERVVWQYVSAHLGQANAARRFAALTDPGSNLEQLACEKGYRLILPTPQDVGGRFSALSVFALFPAALVGIDIEEVVAFSRETERECTRDDPKNPALQLASFLYGAYRDRRDKFSLILPSSGQVFGLWVEQLVAESLGKEGRGILPNVEVDASILSVPRDDRSVITYAVGSCEGFRESIAHLDKSIPTLCYDVDTPHEAFSRFVVWEYAIAFLGILLETFPFDQPDVELTKRLVKELLANHGRVGEYPDCREFAFDDGLVKNLRISSALLEGGTAGDAASPAVKTYGATDNEDNGAATRDITVDQALRTLFDSLRLGDYFSLNAFVPFRGYGRREALERMRNRVASRLGVVSCLEIGPRYLHSTGQLHKGGPNTGVFLLISADEDNDIAIPGEDFTLGTLAAIQAQGDFAALAARGRRVVQVHLSGNDSETLSRFADRLCAAVSAIKPRQSSTFAVQSHE
jgi:glucose-6-phosphate isomerase